MKIVSARTRTERWPLDGTGAARGRTERIGILLDLITDDGRCGIGEASPLPGLSTDTLADAQAALDAFVARVARAPLQATFAPAAQFARGAPSARFAIETAVLALTGDLPAVHVTTLPASVVVDSAEPRDAPYLKIKVGPGLDRAHIEAIARANPHARLRLDANRAWPRARVHAYLAALADLPIDYVEEPCLDAHELLAHPLAVPIALDESLAFLSEPALARALASPGLAALVLKPTLLGGFTASRALALRAAAHGKPVLVTHALESPVGRAACDALARSFRTGAPETGDGPRFSPAVIVAHPSRATLDAITRAWAARTPIALLHARASAAEQARQRALVEAAALQPDDAVILFTSGSTGAPRGVVLSRAAIDAAVAASAAHLGWRDDDRWLLALSTAHAGGLAVVARCLAANKPIVRVEREGERGALVAALAECTLASLVPTQLAMLLDDRAWRPPRALRAILLGGAAAPRPLLEAAAQRGVPFLISYGLTETFGQVATAPLARAGDPDAPLVLLPHAELLAGTRATPAPIRIRGKMLATRYLDGAPIAPEYTTADLGYLDAGVLHVLGRADEVIITGGENIHPTQVEALLVATPGVRGACVFGVPDERWGQIIGAALAVDATFDQGRALADWQQRLAPHARPRVLALASTLPLLPTGKLDRRAAAALPRGAVSYDGRR
ncbi:MAG: AMP-binding protein [Kofleriaceae bacterium]|nr:AMP-binding protein [Kofleriaceae bacterium]